MKRGGYLSTFHIQFTMAKFCMCFLQIYQHPPCLTQPICLHSKSSLDNANNGCVTLLFHNISLAHAYLRAVTMRVISNVEGIHQQTWHWDGTTECLAPFGFGGISNGWIATIAFLVEEETWGQHKTDWWKGESIWLEYILRNWVVGMRIPDCFCIIAFVPLTCVPLWNDAKS